jgi:hypothetical protein
MLDGTILRLCCSAGKPCVTEDIRDHQYSAVDAKRERDVAEIALNPRTKDRHRAVRDAIAVLLHVNATAKKCRGIAGR